MVFSSAKASEVALWSFSSSLTTPRQKSEPITWVGLKCLAAKVDLPEPETPTSRTSPIRGTPSTRGSRVASSFGSVMW